MNTIRVDTLFGVFFGMAFTAAVFYMAGNQPVVASVFIAVAALSLIALALTIPK